MDHSPNSSIVKLAQLLAGTGAAIATRGIAIKGYERLTRREAPQDPTDPGVDWSDAIAFTIAASVAAGVSRLIGRRFATKVVAGA